MIDLTPLDVRNKRRDFRKGMRGYETQEVDSFLELAAERLEELVRENLQLKERTQALEAQVRSQTDREAAVRDALVTAQELRTEIREQARQEADKIVEDAHTESRRMIAEAEAEVRIRLRNSERKADMIERSLAELERGRLRFLRSFRQLLEREMDVVEVEEARTPLDDRSFELDLGPFARRWRPVGSGKSLGRRRETPESRGWSTRLLRSPVLPTESRTRTPKTPRRTVAPARRTTGTNPLPRRARATACCCTTRKTKTD